jgi:hypothetical protein
MAGFTSRSSTTRFCTSAEHKAGLDYAIAQGWLELHESGTYVRFTQSGNDLFA